MNKFGVFTLTALGTLGVVAGGTAIALSTPQVQDKLKDRYSETIVVEVPGQTEPEEPTININLADYEFTLDEENKTATITKYNGTDANLVLPSTLSVTEEGEYIAGEDYSVTAIGNDAFASNYFIHYVTIPEGVTSIGANAFGTCSYLLNISLPESLTSISSDAFSKCSNLQSIVIPNSVTTMGSNIFSSCKKLKIVKLSENFAQIQSNSFSYCSSLESIVIPKCVSSISVYAFMSCSKLSNVVIESISVYESATANNSTADVGGLLNNANTIKVLATIVDNEENVNEFLNNSENYTRTLDDDGVYYTYTKVVNEETV